MQVRVVTRGVGAVSAVAVLDCEAFAAEHRVEEADGGRPLLLGGGEGGEEGSEGGARGEMRVGSVGREVQREIHKK